MKDINATVLVDLSLPEQELMNTLQKDARWGIRKAEREGLIVEQTQKDSDWDQFYKIYYSEITSKGIKAETIEHIKKYGNIFFVCKLNGKIISGATLQLEGGLRGAPKLSRNASEKDSLKFQPNNLLYWHCILWAKKNGYEFLDLGGWQIKAVGQIKNVNRFKERWGKVIYFTKEYPLPIAIGRKLLRRFNFLRRIKRRLLK